jgi:hypothetical protein
MKYCPSCGNKYNDELQVCVVDGASLLRFNPDADTLSLTMSEDDKIIELTSALRTLSENNKEFTVKFAELGQQCGFESGDAKKHLEIATKEADLEIVRCGDFQASLRKRSQIFIA